jgi:hypothetical protein
VLAVGIGATSAIFSLIDSTPPRAWARLCWRFGRIQL